MIKNIRQEKGITMITVTIAVIILLVITGILMFNAKDAIYIRNYNNLKNDIDVLRDKIANFYNQNGSIPAKAPYLSLSVDMNSVLNQEESNNKDEFYVIDLQVLDGLTLNYGKDYEKVKDLTTVSDYYSDLYIIHKTTHNIFLVGGVLVQDGNTSKIYYTDYTEPDNTKVDFRYVDGIKIPENYYYIGRDVNENIVIAPDINQLVNSSSEEQYTWQKTTEIVQDAVLVEDQTQKQYEASTKKWGGYYYNTNTKKVIYLPVEIDTAT